VPGEELAQQLAAFVGEHSAHYLRSMVEPAIADEVP